MTIEDRLRVVCSECKAEVAFGRLGRCPACQGILQAEYDDAAVGSLKDVRPGRGIGRYWKTLPLRTAPESLLAEGDTPLIASRRIAIVGNYEHPRALMAAGTLAWLASVAIAVFGVQDLLQRL